MATTVFYAWQSDRDVDICRFLIRDAAKLAVKKLNAEASVAVKSAPPFDLDHDTKGTTGHQHIASVIRKKIKGCGVFIADLTHVARYETADDPPRKKRAQNPNVLIELGIAIRAKGFGRLILIMNDAFGSPDDLPFDLKSHSYPITYTLKDTSDPEAVKKAKERLAEAIKGKLKPMLSEIAAVQAESESEELKGKLDDIKKSREELLYGRLNSGDHFNFPTGRSALVLDIWPTRPDRHLAIGNLYEQLKETGGLRVRDDQFARVEIESYSVMTVQHLDRTDREGPIRSLCEVRHDGNIFAIMDLLVERESTESVWGHAFDIGQDVVMAAASRFLAFLRTLGVNGPVAVGVGAINLKGLKLVPSATGSTAGVKPLKLNVYQFGPLIVPSDDQLEKVLRDLFDNFWRASGHVRRPGT